MPGFNKGRKLDKIGLKAQDTVELSFEDVIVPAANRLGEEGTAFGYLGVNLAQERVAIAVGSVAQARAALDLTIEYVSRRRVFGHAVSSFQNTKFELAAMATEIEAGQALLDKGIAELVAGELSPADAAMVKLFCTELQGRVVDRCLQLFGGFGYINESGIARLYADMRGGREDLRRHQRSHEIDHQQVARLAQFLSTRPPCPNRPPRVKRRAICESTASRRS